MSQVNQKVIPEGPYWIPKKILYSSPFRALLSPNKSFSLTILFFKSYSISGRNPWLILQGNLSRDNSRFLYCSGVVQDPLLLPLPKSVLISVLLNQIDSSEIHVILWKIQFTKNKEPNYNSTLLSTQFCQFYFPNWY